MLSSGLSGPMAKTLADLDKEAKLDLEIGDVENHMVRDAKDKTNDQNRSLRAKVPALSQLDSDRGLS